jgi:hypothetical protein
VRLVVGACDTSFAVYVLYLLFPDLLLHLFAAAATAATSGTGCHYGAKKSMELLITYSVQVSSQAP